MNKKYIRYKDKTKVDSRKKNAGSIEECLKSAYRLLGYRQRSEIELRNKLSGKFTQTVIDTVIERLRDKHMIDDEAFAQYWREQREALNPRSRRVVAIELRKKGIDKEVINRALDGYNDKETAYHAVKKKASLWAGYNYYDFKRKMGPFLLRRGFNYEVANQTVDRLWSERV
jgi:regulatory protein